RRRVGRSERLYLGRVSADEIESSPESAQAMTEGSKKGQGLGLYTQVLIAIVAGIALGVLAPEWGVLMRPLGEAFVKLIKMLIAPIVFTTVVVGIASMGDLKKVGRIGVKAVLYFEVMTTLALILGLLVVHIVRPGHGVHADPSKLDTGALQQTLKGEH